MLIECPKCGFSQPQDRYCAKCGIDMLGFKPRSPSLWRRFITNPFVIISLVLGVSVSAFYFIRHQESSALKERVAYMKGGVTLLEKPPEVIEYSEEASRSDTATDEVPPTPVTIDTAVAAPVESPVSPEPNTNLTNSPTNKLTSSSTINETGQPTSAKKTSLSTVSLIFLETSAPLADRWEKESEASGQAVRFDSVFRGPLPDYKANLSKAPGVKILHQVQQKLEANGTFQWFQTIKSNGDPDTDQGLIVFAVIQLAEDGKLLRGELEIQRSFKEGDRPDASLVKKSITGAFEMTADAAYMITNLFPKRVSLDESETLNLQGVFRIYNSRAFSSGQSQSVVLLSVE